MIRNNVFSGKQNYTSITINAPASAAPGDQVLVTVTITNISNYRLVTRGFIMVDETQRAYDQQTLNNYGDSMTVSYLLKMGTVLAGIYAVSNVQYDDGNFYSDSYATKDIKSTAPALAYVYGNIYLNDYSYAAGATVKLIIGSTVLETTTTNAYGYYSFATGLTLNLTYTITASKSGYVDRTLSFNPTSATSYDKEMVMQLATTAKASLSGNIWDNDTHAFIFMATITVKKSDGTVVATAQTNAAGRYSFGEIFTFGEHYTVAVSATGYNNMSGSFTPISPTVAWALDLSMGAVVIPTTTLNGWVHDASGKAVSAAAVTVKKADGTLVATATTAADGTYFIANSIFSIGTTYTIAATKSGYNDNSATSAAIQGWTVNITLAIPPSTPAISNVKVVSYDTPVMGGFTCNVKIQFDYFGPAGEVKAHAALGNIGALGFDEVVFAEMMVTVPAQTAAGTLETTIPIKASSSISPGTYDVYAKINTVISPFVENVVVVKSPPVATVSNVKVISYDTPVKQGDYCNVKIGFDYIGPAGKVTARAAIGNIKTIFGQDSFDEVIFTNMDVTVSEQPTVSGLETTIPIQTTSAISPGIYDIYAKVNSVISPFVPDVINVGSITPTEPVITNVAVKSYTTPVQIGAACVVGVTYDYVGPATTQKLDCAIGNNGLFGFDEILRQSIDLTIPKTDAKKTLSASITITITEAISKGVYSIYARIMNVNSPILEQVITVESITIPPTNLGVLTGQVTDAAGKALANVSVNMGQKYSAMTNTSGSYTIKDIIPGDYAAAFTKVDYKTFNSQLNIKSGNNIKNVSMKADTGTTTPSDNNGLIIAGVVAAALLLGGNKKKK